MRKLLAVLVAAIFALSAGSVFAASHAGGKMDDKKMDKKDDKMDKKMDKKSDKMDKKMDKMEKKDDKHK